jgi:hypothetical protein
VLLLLLCSSSLCLISVTSIACHFPTLSSRLCHPSTSSSSCHPLLFILAHGSALLLSCRLSFSPSPFSLPSPFVMSDDLPVVAKRKMLQQMIRKGGCECVRV